MTATSSSFAKGCDVSDWVAERVAKSPLCSILGPSSPRRVRPNSLKWSRQNTIVVIHGSTLTIADVKLTHSGRPFDTPVHECRHDLDSGLHSGVSRIECVACLKPSVHSAKCGQLADRLRHIPRRKKHGHSAMAALSHAIDSEDIAIMADDSDDNDSESVVDDWRVDEFPPMIACSSQLLEFVACDWSPVPASVFSQSGLLAAVQSDGAVRLYGSVPFTLPKLTRACGGGYMSLCTATGGVTALNHTHSVDQIIDTAVDNHSDGGVQIEGDIVDSGVVNESMADGIKQHNLGVGHSDAFSLVLDLSFHPILEGLEPVSIHWLTSDRLLVGSKQGILCVFALRFDTALFRSLLIDSPYASRPSAEERTSLSGVSQTSGSGTVSSGVSSAIETMDTSALKPVSIGTGTVLVDASLDESPKMDSAISSGIRPIYRFDDSNALFKVTNAFTFDCCNTGGSKKPTVAKKGKSGRIAVDSVLRCERNEPLYCIDSVSTDDSEGLTRYVALGLRDAVQLWKVQLDISDVIQIDESEDEDKSEDIQMTAAAAMAVGGSDDDDSHSEETPKTRSSSKKKKKKKKKRKKSKSGSKSKSKSKKSKSKKKKSKKKKAKSKAKSAMRSRKKRPVAMDTWQCMLIQRPYADQLDPKCSVSFESGSELCAGHISTVKWHRHRHQKVAYLALTRGRFLHLLWFKVQRNLLRIPMSRDSADLGYSSSKQWFHPRYKASLRSSAVVPSTTTAPMPMKSKASSQTVDLPKASGSKRQLSESKKSDVSATAVGFSKRSEHGSTIGRRVGDLKSGIFAEWPMGDLNSIAFIDCLNTGVLPKLAADKLSDLMKPPATDRCGDKFTFENARTRIVVTSTDGGVFIYDADSECRPLNNDPLTLAWFPLRSVMRVASGRHHFSTSKSRDEQLDDDTVEESGEVMHGSAMSGDMCADSSDACIGAPTIKRRKVIGGGMSGDHSLDTTSPKRETAPRRKRRKTGSGTRIGPSFGVAIGPNGLLMAMVHTAHMYPTTDLDLGLEAKEAGIEDTEESAKIGDGLVLPKTGLGNHRRVHLYPTNTCCNGFVQQMHAQLQLRCTAANYDVHPANAGSFFDLLPMHRVFFAKWFLDWFDLNAKQFWFTMRQKLDMVVIGAKGSIRSSGSVAKEKAASKKKKKKGAEEKEEGDKEYEEKDGGGGGVQDEDSPSMSRCEFFFQNIFDRCDGTHGEFAYSFPESKRKYAYDSVVRAENFCFKQTETLRFCYMCLRLLISRATQHSEIFVNETLGRMELYLSECMQTLLELHCFHFLKNLNVAATGNGDGSRSDGLLQPVQMPEETRVKLEELRQKTAATTSSVTTSTTHISEGKDKAEAKATVKTDPSLVLDEEESSGQSPTGLMSAGPSAADATSSMAGTSTFVRSSVPTADSWLRAKRWQVYLPIYLMAQWLMFVSVSRLEELNGEVQRHRADVNEHGHCEQISLKQVLHEYSLKRLAAALRCRALSDERYALQTEGMRHFLYGLSREEAAAGRSQDDAERVNFLLDTQETCPVCGKQALVHQMHSALCGQPQEFAPRSSHNNTETSSNIMEEENNSGIVSGPLAAEAPPSVVQVMSASMAAASSSRPMQHLLSRCCATFAILPHWDAWHCPSCNGSVGLEFVLRQVAGVGPQRTAWFRHAFAHVPKLKCPICAVPLLRLI